MTKTIQRITRAVILLLLLRFVYFETGAWTVLALSLIFIGAEIQGYIIARWTNEINSIILSSHEPKGKGDK